MSSFALALISAFIWGLSAFLEKWGLRSADAMAAVVARTFGVLAGCALFALVVPTVPGRFVAMPWRAKVALMGGGLLASVVAQLFFYRALQQGEVGKVASVGGTWPLFAFLLSVLFLQEPLTLQKVGGVVLVTLGVVLLK